jgi:type II secretory ATPase GspE/PulE/Tfp pilus assembly ATPase PilB-like protein
MSDDSKVAFLGNINRDFEERETESRAQKLGLGYVNLDTFPLDIDALKILPRHKSKEAKIFPLSQSRKKVKLAVVDPQNSITCEVIQSLEKEKTVELFLCSEGGFRSVFKAYDTDMLYKKTVERKTSFSEKENTNLSKKIADLAELENKIASLHAETALGEIELSAIKADASDIHFQPGEKNAILRFRVDGILHDVLHMDGETHQKIITRIKYEAGMKSNISDIPQDGHSRFRVNNRSIDLRISTLPTPIGESVVMRLLDSERGVKTFSELGLSPHIQDDISSVLQTKNGLILVTGPTGSGKTTTLYSMMSEINSSDKKIVTLEDPIEYQIPGISQSQVNEKKEYNFETGLQALLRHDPDVILVGEIRSQRTAKLASEAALTGHVVLSSLHTNSAIGALSRLRNLGLENFNIAPTITAIFAQRLIRKVCPHCKTQESFSQNPTVKKAIQRIKKVLPDQSIPSSLVRSQGCEKCSHTGYMGREAICEAFLMSDEIRNMILEEKSELEMEAYLKEKTRFLSLFEEGLLLVLKQKTTLEELFRVVG